MNTRMTNKAPPLRPKGAEQQIKLMGIQEFKQQNRFLTTSIKPNLAKPEFIFKGYILSSILNLIASSVNFFILASSSAVASSPLAIILSISHHGNYTVYNWGKSHWKGLQEACTWCSGDSARAISWTEE